MRRPPALVCALAPLLLLGLTACGGGGGGGSPGSSDVAAPAFGGLASVATAGGAFVRLEWQAAVDETSPAGAIAYRVYAAASAGGQDFGAPIATVGGGGTSIVVSSATSPLIAIGSEVFFVVRAVDAAGNQDANLVELSITPVAAGAVAYVSDTAGGAGTLGDPTDPFPSVQDGVTAVEGAGGGVVLVDAAAGGTTYAEEVDLTAAVSGIGLYGGFARFSTLPGGAGGDVVLASRDPATRTTTLSAAGLHPLVDGDLLRVANAGSPTHVDGFRFDDLRPILGPLTGTVHVQQGTTLVEGTGTLFLGEAPSGTVFALDAAGIPVQSSNADTDTLLFLAGPYRGPTASGPASVLGAPTVAVRALDANLRFTACRVHDGATLVSDTTLATDSSTLCVVGTRFEDTGSNGVVVGGGVRRLVIANTEIRERGTPVASGPTTTGNVEVLAAGTEIVLEANLLRDNRAGSGSNGVALAFDAADPGAGGALTVRATGNEMRNLTGNALELFGLGEVGDGGSANVEVAGNLLNGISSSQVELDTQRGGGAPYVGVDITIVVRDNDLTNGNSIPVDVDLGVSAGRTTSLAVQDNRLAIGESEAIEVADESAGSAGASDGGVFDLLCLRNVTLGGIEDIQYEVGVTHGGRTVLEVRENTVLSSEDEGFSLDIESYVGTTAGMFAFPDGVFSMNIFNNDVEAHDDEPYEIDDDRSTSSLGIAAFVYAGHGFNMNGSDPSDGALTIITDGDDAAWLVERQFCGLGGADSTEVGIEVDQGSTALRNQIRLLNNVVTLGSGGGIEWRAGCWPQIINNTSAYAGQDGEAGFEFSGSLEDGDSQALVLNCIASHSGGWDIDTIHGVRPTYTLARDDSLVGGLGNLLGMDPAYATDVSDLGTSLRTHEEIQTLFQLLPASPARDAGHPAAMYADPDGSRNDMGAYGGPGAGPVGLKAAGTPLPMVYVGAVPTLQLHTGALLPSDTQVLRFGFTRPVALATLTAGITVSNGGVPVSGVFSTEAGGRVVAFTPDTTLGAGPIVEVTLDTDLQSASGAPLAYAWTERFGLRPALPTPEAEPNDDGVAGVGPADLAAAQATGVGPASGTFELTAGLATSTDVDVYAVSVDAGDRLMATTLHNRLGLPSDGSFHLDLYDATGVRVTRGRRLNFNDRTNTFSSTGDAYVDHVFETGGTYFLVVSNPTLAGPQPYGLLGQLD